MSLSVPKLCILSHQFIYLTLYIVYTLVSESSSLTSSPLYIYLILILQKSCQFSVLRCFLLLYMVRSICFYLSVDIYKITLTSYGFRFYCRSFVGLSLLVRRVSLLSISLSTIVSGLLYLIVEVYQLSLFSVGSKDTGL